MQLLQQVLDRAAFGDTDRQQRDIVAVAMNVPLTFFQLAVKSLGNDVQFMQLGAVAMLHDQVDRSAILVVDPRPTIDIVLGKQSCHLLLQAEQSLLIGGDILLDNGLPFGIDLAIGLQDHGTMSQRLPGCERDLDARHFFGASGSHGDQHRGVQQPLSQHRLLFGHERAGLETAIQCADGVGLLAEFADHLALGVEQRIVQIHQCDWQRQGISSVSDNLHLGGNDSQFFQQERIYRAGRRFNAQQDPVEELISHVVQIVRDAKTIVVPKVEGRLDSMPQRDRGAGRRAEQHICTFALESLSQQERLPDKLTRAKHQHFLLRIGAEIQTKTRDAVLIHAKAAPGLLA
ncbi:hypothetical protein D3C72_413440 [compost metagenome]